MKPAIKKLWTENLLNGEYKQTEGRLRDQAGFCCLGVLCDLYKKETGNGYWNQYPEGCYEFVDISGVKMNYTLADPVVAWAGLEDNNPDVTIEDTAERALGSLNDEGYTFEQIAKLIEEQL